MRRQAIAASAALGITVCITATTGGAADAGSASTAALAGACYASESDIRAQEAGDRVGVHTVNDVDAGTPGDAWAAGVGGPRGHGAALHWNGDGWSSTQPPSGWFGEMWGVDAPGPQDVWAVGHHGRRWVARHWDGAEWTEYAAGAGWSQLRAVDAVDSDDIWAVGSHLCDQREVPLALHWDGSQWSKTLFPEGTPPEFQLQSVYAQATDDVWAVGESYGSRAFHWDGRRWSPASKGLQDRWYLEEVTVVAPDRIWAVGRAYAGGLASTLLVEWDGSRWVRLPSANSDDPDNQLYGIDVVAPDDVWAVGTSSENSDDLARSLIEHWDGDRWRVVPSPSPGKASNVLFAVSASGPDDAWAVGARSADPLWWFEGAQLFLHWNGHDWTWVRKSR